MKIFQKTKEEKDADWEFVVKMMCIIKDLMNGNENLPEGCEEERLGHKPNSCRFPKVKDNGDNFDPNRHFPQALLILHLTGMDLENHTY